MSKPTETLTVVGIFAVLACFVVLIVLATKYKDESEKRKHVIDATTTRIKVLEAQLAAAPPNVAKTIKAVRVELARMRRDVDVCHKRVNDVFWSLQVVARVPGARVHAPTTPTRKRPK